MQQRGESSMQCEDEIDVVAILTAHLRRRLIKQRDNCRRGSRDMGRAVEEINRLHPPGEHDEALQPFLDSLTQYTSRANNGFDIAYTAWIIHEILPRKFPEESMLDSILSGLDMSLGGDGAKVSKKRQSDLLQEITGWLIDVIGHIFKDKEVSWIRICAVLYITEEVIIKVVQTHEEHLLSGVINAAIFSLNKAGVHAWVAIQGGWNTLIGATPPNPEDTAGRLPHRDEPMDRSLTVSDKMSTTPDSSPERSIKPAFSVPTARIVTYVVYKVAQKRLEFEEELFCAVKDALETIDCASMEEDEDAKEMAYEAYREIVGDFDEDYMNEFLKLEIIELSDSKVHRNERRSNFRKAMRGIVGTSELTWGKLISMIHAIVEVGMVHAHYNKDVQEMSRTIKLGLEFFESIKVEAWVLVDGLSWKYLFDETNRLFVTVEKPSAEEYRMATSGDSPSRESISHDSDEPSRHVEMTSPPRVRGSKRLMRNPEGSFFKRSEESQAKRPKSGNF